MSVEDVIRGAHAERRRIVAYLRGINERVDKSVCNEHPDTPMEGCARCDGKRQEVYYTHQAASDIELGKHNDENDGGAE